MTRLLPLLAASLVASLAACAPPELCDGEPVITPTAPSAVNGLFHAAHAHNDYEHPRPLEDALAAGFTSVEVDVWFRDDAIQVSHDAFTSKGTLEALYLDKLDALLAEDPSVHDDGAPFTLWLDLKDGSETLQKRLVETLASRPWLTTFDDDGVIEQRGVTVILTGDDAAKRALVETPAPRPFARDSNSLALDDEADPRVIASALSFGAYVGAWDGADLAGAAALSRQCGCVVERAHALGRKVRLFGGPDTPASWTFQLDHGVDFVNADDLDGLAQVLRAR